MWLRTRTPTARPAPPLPLAELPDNLLVRESKVGNHLAYAELTGRYQDRIFTLILGHIQSREDAIDLTQDVFLRAHRRLESFREDSLFYTWLYRIALNACIDFRRRRSRAPEPFSLDGDLLEEVGFEPRDARPASDPVRVLENKELGRYLRECIRALPEVLRVAVILHDLEGLPQKEIARIMGCPLGTVKSRIQRGRYELRERLEAFMAGAAEHDDEV
jgi:RNA polymerase sigma-70 factor (ECF subfamily)